MTKIADFDDLRSLGFASISASFASVGVPLTRPVRAVCFINDTQGSMVFTNDTTKDKIFVKSGSFKLWDAQANKSIKDDTYVFPVGTQWSVKQLEAPVSGSVYIEGLIC